MKFVLVHGLDRMVLNTLGYRSGQFPVCIRQKKL